MERDTNQAHELPATEVGRVADLCQKFEAAWRSGTPRLEDFLAESDPAERETLFRRLLRVDLGRRQERGEAPSTEDYLARFPDLAPIVREEVGGCVAAGAIKRPDRSGVRTTPYAAESATAPVIPGYEVRGRLGRGGMGEVLRVHDPVFDRALAVKVMLPGAGDQAEAERRFLAEARVTGRLQHPGIPPVHEIGRMGDGRPYLAMKLVEGSTLQELLARRSAPAEDLPRFVAVFGQICQAVGYAHSQGVIHRDLKPHNVMVGAFGEVQVMDWGLAKVLADADAAAEEAAGPVGEQSPETQTGRILGTPAFMAPEQARGEVGRLDERADVFGLGGILCVILTGRPVFVGTDAHAVHREAQAGEVTGALARLAACGADAELVALARRCLEADPAGRPRNAGEVAVAVAAYQEGVERRARRAELERAAAEARAVGARAKAAAERRARRLTLTLAASVLLLVLAGGGVAWLVQQQHAEALARRQRTDDRIAALLEQARATLNHAWESADDRRLAECLDMTERAQTLGRDGEADGKLRADADALHAAVTARIEQARKNRALLAALLDVTRPRETGTYRVGPGGLTVSADIPAEDQYVAAFRRWGAALDRMTPQDLARRIRQQPPPVREEILAGVDEWLRDRRRRHDPGAKQLRELADRLDADPVRRQLRVLQQRSNAPPEQRQKRLRELARKIEPSSDRLLSAVTLVHTLYEAGDEEQAEKVLRQLVEARPSEVVLVNLLGRLLVQKRPPRWAEAVEWYRTGRALRPELGLALARSLTESGRADEAEKILARMAGGQPANPDLYFLLGLARYDQKKWPDAAAAFKEAVRLRPDHHDALNNLGVVLRELNRYEDAEAALRKAVAQRPDAVAGYLNLSAALYSLKKLDEAEGVCRKAIALKPDLAEAHTNLGAILRGKKKLDEAEKSLRHAIALKPDLAEAHTNLGELLENQGKLADAIASFRAAAAARPASAPAHMRLGVALAEAKRFAEAERSFRRVIELRPDSAEAHVNLGSALMEQHKPDDGVASIRRGIKLRADALGYYSLGNALLGLRKLDDAEAAYRDAIKLRADHAPSYFGLGVALHEKGKPADAVAAYRKSLELKPDGATAYNLGNVLRALDRPGEAIKAYHQAIKLRPDHAESHVNLGVVYMGQDKYADAAAAFRRAVALSPESADWNFNLGMALGAQEKWGEAVQSLRKASVLDPKMAKAHYHLGAALAQQREWAQAEAAFRATIKLQPNHAAAYNGLGSALQARHRPGEAADSYRKVAELLPTLAGPQYNLGNALRDQGKLDDAIVAYRKAIKLEPGYAEVHCNLGHVLRRQGRFTEALESLKRGHELGKKRPSWRYASADWVAACERLVKLDAKLPRVLEGKAVASAPEENLELARLCQFYRQRPLAAVRFYTAAFAVGGKRAADLKNEHRYSAACCAALAAAGRGTDAAKLDDKERTRLRKQALDWLRADLVLRGKQLKSGKAADRAAVQQEMRHWQKDSDLAGLRDKDTLARLPAEDRAAFARFWADVAALLKKADTPAGPEGK